MPTTSQCVAATALLAGTASAFVTPQPIALQSRQGRSQSLMGSRKLSMVLVDKPGTGENRMTSTGFGEPLVEKKDFPGTTHGYQVCSPPSCDAHPLLHIHACRKVLTHSRFFDPALSWCSRLNRDMES